jgi:hypothetical protein
MIASTSIESTARRLTELLPTVDLPDGVLQWQAQLLSNCSGHVFVPHGADITVPMLWQAVLESSLAQLSMQTVIADLRSQNEAQTNQHQRLERELKEAEERNRRQESQFQLLQSGSSRGTTHNARFPTSPKYSSPTYQSPRPSSSKASTSGLNDFSPPTILLLHPLHPAHGQLVYVIPLVASRRHLLITTMIIPMHYSSSATLRLMIAWPLNNVLSFPGPSPLNRRLIVFPMHYNFSASSMLKIVRLPRNVLSSPNLSNACLSVAYVWKKCLRTPKLALILVGTRSAATAYADMSPLV